MGYRLAESNIKHQVVGIAAETNFPSGSAPQVLDGNTIIMARVAPDSLGCLVTTTPATSTLTIYARWQVSDNSTTWYNCAQSNNAANVIIATGTVSATSVVIAAPGCVYAWRYARIELYTGVASSTTGDLGAAFYSYRENY
jgi:hypothetical protein